MMMMMMMVVVVVDGGIAFDFHVDKDYLYLVGSEEGDNEIGRAHV